MEKIGRSATIIAAGTLTSRILGYLRDSLMVALFSALAKDAWIVAFRLPNVFRRLLGEGSLSVSLLPIITEAMKKDGGEPGRETKEVINGVFTVLVVLLTLLTVIGVVFAADIIEWITRGEGYSSIEGKVEVTVRWARIMFPYIFLVSLYAFGMSVLNAVGSFVHGAFAPVLWNLAMIVCMFVPDLPGGIHGDVLAYGVLIGGVFQLIYICSGLKRKNLLPRFTMKFRNPAVTQVFQNMVPGLLGLGVLQGTILINTTFASHLPQGANTWIFLADRILELPLSLFAVSLSSALLPTLSRLWVQGEKEEVSRTTSYYLCQVLFISIPAAVGVFFLSEMIVSLLFERGHFVNSDVVQTGKVLRIYSWAVVSFGVIRIMAPTFYAVKNTWFPSVSSLMALGLHAVLAGALIDRWGVEGLVGSSMVSATVNMSLLLVGYRWFVGPYDAKVIFKKLTIYLASSLPMVAVLYFFVKWQGAVHLRDPMSVVNFVAASSLALGAYFLCCHSMGLQEVSLFLNRVKNLRNRKG